MKIEIHNQFTLEGKEFYYWELNDGPEEIDEVKGFATDLVEVFSKIIEWRERLAKDYIENNETV
jgi:hypothetical protein